uniref:Zinc finger CCCH domain-containing protein n=1 Tax=Rhabditophanes sp. KR3021 TaxID=114890 RepID=A0AC35U9A1_9BILA
MAESVRIAKLDDGVSVIGIADYCDQNVIVDQVKHFQDMNEEKDIIEDGQEKVIVEDGQERAVIEDTSDKEELEDGELSDDDIGMFKETKVNEYKAFLETIATTKKDSKGPREPKDIGEMNFNIWNEVAELKNMPFEDKFRVHEMDPYADLNPFSPTTSNGLDCSGLTEDERILIEKRRAFQNKMKYLGEEFIPSQKLLCKFYRDGYCREGVSCVYSHKLEDSNRIPELCEFYKHKSCSRGLQCKMMHGEFPCYPFHAHNKCSYEFRKKCKFSHEPLDKIGIQIIEGMKEDRKKQAMLHNKQARDEAINKAFDDWKSDFDMRKFTEYHRGIYEQFAIVANVKNEVKSEVVGIESTNQPTNQFIEECLEVTPGIREEKEIKAELGCLDDLINSPPATPEEIRNEISDQIDIKKECTGEKGLNVSSEGSTLSSSEEPPVEKSFNVLTDLSFDIFAMVDKEIALKAKRSKLYNGMMDEENEAKKTIRISTPFIPQVERISKPLIMDKPKLPLLSNSSNPNKMSGNNINWVRPCDIIYEKLERKAPSSSNWTPMNTFDVISGQRKIHDKRHFNNPPIREQECNESGYNSIKRTVKQADSAHYSRINTYESTAHPQGNGLRKRKLSNENPNGYQNSRKFPKKYSD